MLVDVGEDAVSEEVSARIVSIVEGVFGVKAAYLHQAHRMEEAVLADIEAHVRGAGRAVLAVSAEEDEVSGDEVFPVVDALSGEVDLAAVTRGDDIVHKEGGAYEAAAVHALGGHAGPEVGEAQHALGGGQDGIGTLVQGFQSPC